MNIKRLEKSDIQELWNIHSGNFAFPDLSNPLYALQRVVRDENGKVVLGAFVKLTSEGIFIIDKDASPITLVKAMKLANDNITDAWTIGLEDCHVFAVNDDHFINLLRELGWTDCTGHPMIRLK